MPIGVWVSVIIGLREVIKFRWKKLKIIKVII
jgi:hypothetical protein